MITASVVIYNTDPALIKTVAASFAPGPGRVLFLVDNSPHPSPVFGAMAGPYIRCIATGRNAGYGAGHNIALRAVLGEEPRDGDTGSAAPDPRAAFGAPLDPPSEFHAVLNPDVSFSPDTIDRLARFLRDTPDAVCATPRIFSPEGADLRPCRLLPTPADLIFRRFVPAAGPLAAWKRARDARYLLSDAPPDRALNAPVLSGCFMFLRTSALREHDILFDERFFMYMEDVDLSRRLHRAGRTLLCPDARAVHIGAHESYKSGRALLAHIKSAVQYFNKWGWLCDDERALVNRTALEEARSTEK